VKLAFTGHRPDKLGGYAHCPKHANIIVLIEAAIRDSGCTEVISGMALGVDQWAAEAAVRLGVPFEAAVPFAGQEKAWPPESQRKYRELLSKATKTTVVYDGGYAGWKMQKRNEYMVDNCDALVAVWDGTDGGTANCHSYALRVKKPVIRIDPTNL
jgi:uncharacterized phage-like protein YoqJ